MFFRRSEWKWLKEHQWKSSRSTNSFGLLSMGAYFDRERGKNPVKQGWFLSKKRPKEGERVARGQFHERAGTSPWGYGIRPFENTEGSKSNFQCKIYGLLIWRVHRHILMQLNCSGNWYLLKWIPVIFAGTVEVTSGRKDKEGRNNNGGEFLDLTKIKINYGSDLAINIF